MVLLALAGVTALALSLVPGLSYSRSSPDRSPGTPVLPHREGWELTWHDEFEGSQLDPTRWSVRAPGKRESAIISAANVSLDGKGHLLLTTTEQDGVIHTGMIGSQGRFAQTFGRWEARIKFQRMEGHHGSFWLQPDSSDKSVVSDASKTGAEIDIVEWFGSDRRDGGTAANVYWPGPDGTKHHDGGPTDLQPVLPAGQELCEEFHVFAVEWSAEEYVFSIDGHVIFRTQQGVSHRPQYAILSLLCADWESPRLDRSRLPEAMTVDYVRVYRRAEQQVTLGENP